MGGGVDWDYCPSCGASLYQLHADDDDVPVFSWKRYSAYTTLSGVLVVISTTYICQLFIEYDTGEILRNTILGIHLWSGTMLSVSIGTYVQLPERHEKKKWQRISDHIAYIENSNPSKHLSYMASRA
jgi:hypothetical protein